MSSSRLSRRNVIFGPLGEVDTQFLALSSPSSLSISWKLFFYTVTNSCRLNQFVATEQPLALVLLSDKGMTSFFQFFAPPRRYGIIEKDTTMSSEEEAGHMLSSSSSENEYLPRYSVPERTTSHTPLLAFLRYIVFTTLFVFAASILIIAGIKQLFFSLPYPSCMPTIAPPTTMTALSLTYDPPMVSPCGNSVAEAKAAGCHFDNIAFAWVPERCWDEDLSKSYRDMKFEFYLGPNRTEPISQEEAYTGKYPHLYVNWGKCWSCLNALRDCYPLSPPFSHSTCEPYSDFYMQSIT